MHDENQPSQEQKPTQEAAHERQARVGIASSGVQQPTEALVNTDEFKRKVEEERNAMFKRQVREFIARSSPEQRKILQDELDKAKSFTQEGGKVQPILQRDLHAELHANEAAKIDRAAADVATRQAPGPAPGVVAQPDVLDMTQYEKIGDQWRMCLGMQSGHMAHRWLSTAEALALGLDGEKEEEVPSPRDLRGQAGGSAPGPHGVPESEGYLVGGDGRRIPIPEEHHGGLLPGAGGAVDRGADLTPWSGEGLDPTRKKE